MRRIGAMIAAATLVGGGFVAMSGTAHAAANYNNCDEPAAYYCQYVSTNWGWVQLATDLIDHHEWAMARGASTNGQSWSVYMDQSSDGGRTWDGWLNTVINTTNYTDSLPDSGIVTRGCVNVNGYSFCTAWH
ncbi:hypothetical protein [Kitasatospora aureofaciens]|uniref:hypothetical protein n=1 Tax=Kitasatospora aureofaciens TaxID=1894 RepID=UPI0036F4882C